ncbi:matrix metalloproteinase-28 isoform X3 [Pteropus medius]|uniref:matrix metalloproteinase-28 isoform X3 n=1 Tax=Pteropus vampyrus TaxID=132908 RepID=UPI00196B395B|nr:matrix metalloproteinase-28 isoform X3 [Pteropus giganteus]
MAARVGLLLRALPLLLWGGLDAQFAERVSQELRREAEAFLEKYGYLSEQVSKAPTSMQFSDAIREFQWVSQLPVSGVLDPATLRQMTRPRCGVADTDSQAAWTERVSTLFAGRRAKMRRKKRFTKQALVAYWESRLQPTSSPSKESSSSPALSPCPLRFPF